VSQKKLSYYLLFYYLLLNTHTAIIYKVSTTVAIFNTRDNVINNTNTVFVVNYFLNRFGDFFHRAPIGNSVEIFTFQPIRHHKQAQDFFRFQDRHFVFHVQRLGENSRTVKHFLNVFFTGSVDFHLATPVVPCCVRRTFRFEDVAEALPELATDVDEVRGVEDLRVHSSVRVEIVVGVVVRIHAARFVLHG